MKLTIPAQALGSLVAVAAIASATTLCADDHMNQEVESLFNGKDLTGWQGNPNLWSVEDGAITGRTGDTPDTKITHNTFLIHEGEPLNNFELRLKYRIVNGNSGIQYRSKVLDQGEFGPIVGGYQADFEAGTRYSGILYEEKGRGILAQRGQMTKLVSDPEKDGAHKVEVLGSVGDTAEIQSVIKDEDWNDYTIIANGNQLTHIINGRVTVSVLDEDTANSAESGILALQVHTGPVMTVQFKDIQLRRID